MSEKKPLVILVIGMAGTGKTTLIHRLQHYCREKGKKSYYINLDPAVRFLPYQVNVDIRDSVNHKEVMQQYQLGPNGSILTSLNLFATKIHQVITLLEGKKDLDWILVDTPGQIEVFTWSASGQLITETFRASFPTVALFVADTSRCVVPRTFVSTMLYSSAVMLKQQVPLLVVFNKTDVVTADVLLTWMTENEALEQAMHSTSTALGVGEEGSGGGSGGEAGEFAVNGGNSAWSYADTLTQSFSLYLQEYYKNLPCACVSAATGDGMENLETAITRARVEAEEDNKLRNENAMLKQEEQIRAQKEQLRGEPLQE